MENGRGDTAWNDGAHVARPDVKEASIERGQGNEHHIEKKSDYDTCINRGQFWRVNGGGEAGQNGSSCDKAQQEIE